MSRRTFRQWVEETKPKDEPVSQLLRTEAEWNDLGLAVAYKEVSYHIDKHGNPLWRADQVETPYAEEVTDAEDLTDIDES